MTVGLRDTPLLPPREGGRLRVPLTPLADAMFQLLIFFMLAANLTPYSALLLQGGPPVASTPGGASGGSGPAAPAGTALWTVENGRLRITGQSFEFDDIPDLAAGLADGIRVVLILRDAARVSDVAAVLERLEGSGISAVSIAAGAG